MSSCSLEDENEVESTRTRKNLTTLGRWLKDIFQRSKSEDIIRDIFSSTFQYEFFQHGFHSVKRISFEVIRQLACIFIKEKVLLDEKRFYRHVVGDAKETAFTVTL